MKTTSLYSERLNEQASSATLEHAKRCRQEYKAAGGRTAWREARMTAAASAPHTVCILPVNGKFIVRKERADGPSYDKQEFAEIADAIAAADATGLSRSKFSRF